MKSNVILKIKTFFTAVSSTDIAVAAPAKEPAATSHRMSVGLLGVGLSERKTTRLFSLGILLAAGWHTFAHAYAYAVIYVCWRTAFLSAKLLA